MTNERYNIKLTTLTPLSIGTGTENNWAIGADYVVKDDTIYLIDIASLVESGININKLSDLLAKGDADAISSLIGKNLDTISKGKFPLPATSNDPIKTTFKNDVYGTPVIPGSSLKGAIRSILFKHLRSERENKNEMVFGSLKDGSDFMRFVKVTDFEMTETSVFNTKLFNLQGYGDEWHGAWKYDAHKSSNKYQPTGFNTLYECVVPGAVGIGSIMFSPESFNRREEEVQSGRIRKATPSTHAKEKASLLSGGIQNFFRIINDHTKSYLEKELDFFNEYHTDKVDEIIDSINNLLSYIPSDNSYALLKMSAGSGFHSITGDWMYNDYVDTGFYTISDTHRKQDIGKHKYKSRRIVTDGENFSLMGFVKISVISAMEYENLRESQSEKHQLIVEARKEKREKAILAKEQNEAAKIQKVAMYSHLMEEAMQSERLGDFVTAINKAKDASCYCTTEKNHIDLIERCQLSLINAQIEELRNNELELLKTSREQKVKAGLGALLDEIFPEGTPKEGDYKVTNVKLCLNKVKQWLKAAGISELPSDQKMYLINTLKRLKENPDKKEIKDWNNRQSKLWKGIEVYLSPQDILSL